MFHEGRHVGKMRGGLEKKTSFFPLIFHPKSTKNRLKHRGKRHSQQKLMKKRFVERLFGEKIDFGDFGAPQGVPKNY